MKTDVGNQLIGVRRRISEAAERVGRDPATIRLIASTRGLMADPVADAARAGIRDFGEDYLPEGVTKRPVVDHAVEGLTWHFTGTLHAPKLHIAVEYFDWLHEFDRLTMVRKLAEVLRDQPKKEIRILIDVNPLGPKKRTGIEISEASQLVRALFEIPNVRVMGLSFKSEMLLSYPDTIEGYKKVAHLSQTLRDEGTLPAEANEIAMGTSRDFERAIELGSTMVRIGKALFGGNSEGAVVDPF